MYEIFNELIKIFFKILYFEVMFRILALDTEMKEPGGTSFLSCSVSMSAFQRQASPQPLSYSFSLSLTPLPPCLTLSHQKNNRDKEPREKPAILYYLLRQGCNSAYISVLSLLLPVQTQPNPWSLFLHQLLSMMESTEPDAERRKGTVTGTYHLCHQKVVVLSYQEHKVFLARLHTQRPGGAQGDRAIHWGDSIHTLKTVFHRGESCERT